MLNSYAVINEERSSAFDESFSDLREAVEYLHRVRNSNCALVLLVQVPQRNNTGKVMGISTVMCPAVKITKTLVVFDTPNGPQIEMWKE